MIPVLNEVGNIFPVCAELASLLPSFPPTEIIFIDDGSLDGTGKKLREAKKRFLPNLRILTHSTPCGKSAALRSGIREARAELIATMDGDGQDVPVHLPEMFALAQDMRGIGKLPLIVGVRQKRQDSFSRKIATWLANRLRRSLLKDGCPDTGAPMKLFPRNLFLELPSFEGQHRFLPALMKARGAEMLCIPVQHRQRLHGKSKYTNIGRALVGLRDLLGVSWLVSRTRTPAFRTIPGE